MTRVARVCVRGGPNGTESFLLTRNENRETETMQLGNYAPPSRVDGDVLQARDAVDRPLVVLVREHRAGIVTKFKPDGGEGVTLDVADIRTGEVWIDVLWMNGAVVDGLAPYVGQALPIKLVWTPSAKGGNPYISVQALTDGDLGMAQQWALANASTFDTVRAQRQAQAANPQVPGAPATPPAWVPQPAAPAPAAPGPIANTPAQVAQQWAGVGQQLAAPAPAPVAPAAMVQPPVAPAAPAPTANGALNPNSPEVAALLAQLAGGQTPPTAG